MTALAVLQEHPELDITVQENEDAIYDELFDAIWPISVMSAGADPYLEEMAIDHKTSEPRPGVTELRLTLTEQRRGTDSSTLMTYRRGEDGQDWILVDVGPA